MPPRPKPSARSERKTLAGDICRKLAGSIVRGDWPVGTRIPPERELCQVFEAGRSSVREALKALELMGMVESRLGDGTFVCERSRFLSSPLMWAIASSEEADIGELVEARRLIETELAALAAERATGGNLERIGETLDEMEASGDDAQRFLAADLGFHTAVAEAAHNRILMTALELLRNLTRRWIREALRDPTASREALEQHKEIFLAIAKRRPDQARAAMGAHLEAMGRRLLGARALGAADGESAP
jgi:GntR family transcriptional regulator, transcriptional repressor for pyruvate dehydrogenase complex